VSFAPSFGYQHSTGALNPAQNVNGSYEGGRLVVSHLLSPTQTIGFNYTGQYANFSNSSPVAGPQSNALLQDFLVTYGQQFKATLWLHLGLGVASNIGVSGGTGLAVSADLTKTFNRTSLAVTYYRGHQFNGFITGAASDRVSVVQSIYWTPRLSTSTSGSYFTAADAYASSQSAWYATEQLNFALTRHLSLSGSFAYLNQVGDGVYILSAKRRFVTMGITWSAATPQGRY
jgi:hypothetical protein